MKELLKKLKILLSLTNKNKKKTVEYTDLAPIDDITNGSEYLKALEWALKNKRVHNIALAGPYGSGKSSVIETFLKKHKKIKKKSLRISMATFTEIKKGNNGGNNPDEHKVTRIERDEIELSILKQLFYKVNYKKIPQSRYRKLHKISWERIWVYLIIICIMIVCASYIFVPDILNSMIEKIEVAGLKLGLNTIISKCSFGVIILIILAALAKLYRSVLSRFRINEVKLPADATLKNNEISKDTVFNKNLDEIVYFFEETKYCIVFFEDLDRLNESSVFIHLRELNTILNNYDVIKNPIVFVYAVKDDIFTDTDRTKFFDFIIPIVPIINSTNSGEILLEKLDESKNLGITHDISQAFVLDVSPYIEDMRILENIYNEFIIYKKTIRTEQELKLSDEVMMAIIIFKNLFPRDFAEIQMERGVIKQAFIDKDNYINKQTNKWQKEIDNSTDVILKYKKDILNNVKELKNCMLMEMVECGSGVLSIGQHDYNEYSISNFMRDDFDLSQLCKWSCCNIRYISGQGYKYTHTVQKFQDFFAAYYERWENLKFIQETGNDELQKELERLKQKIKNISGWSIKKLIEEFGAQSVLSEDVLKNKLLVFMLRRGYIDEKYANYINYFKGNSLTKDDMNFILSVKNMEPYPFTYDLTKTSMIVQRLQPYEFNQKAVYNFDLLDYMLSGNENDVKLQTFIKQLSDGSEKSWTFIDEYMNITPYSAIFVRLLSSKWNGMWDYIFNNTSLIYSRKVSYLSMIINEASVASLIAMNSIGNMSKFIVGNEDILRRLSCIQNHKLIEAIEAIGVIFNNILIDDVSDDILNYIFDNNRYELNHIMIQRLVEYKDSKLAPKLKCQNYTAIIELGYKPLIEYIHKNISEYTEYIVLSENNVHESIEQIIDLLIRNIDNSDTCLKIINHEDFCIKNIEDCCGVIIDANKQAVNIIWDELLRQNKLYTSWENVYSYWIKYGFTQELVKYIEKHADKLYLMNCECINDTFIRELILSEIDDNTFKQLLPKLKLNNFDIELQSISEERVSAMVNCQYFEFNESNYNELQEVYPTLCADFIVNNQNDYMQIVDDIPMDSSLFECLVLNPRVESENKQRLFDIYGNNYMNANIAKHLSELKVEMNIKIFNTAWEYLNEDEKCELMLNNLDLLNADQFEKCFADLQARYSGFISRDWRHNVEIDNSEENNRLAKRLHEVNYITSYKGKEVSAFDPVTGAEIKKSILKCIVKAQKP